MGKPLIYTASKTCHAAKWLALRASGVDINSTWIDEAGEGQSTDLSDLAERCIKEAAQCDFLLLYCEPHEVLKGALFEAGAALGAGRIVVCVGTCANWSDTFAKHPNWTFAKSIEDAVAAMNTIYDLV